MQDSSFLVLEIPHQLRPIPTGKKLEGCPCRDVLARKLGKTREQVFAGETGRDPKGRRGQEINKWLEEHPVDSFCVVDDETVDITPFVDNSKVVKTDMKYGLTIENARRIIDVLNKEETK